MGRRANFTEAQITRATRGARRADPNAIVEVTPSGVIRILPPDAAPAQRPGSGDPVEDWFSRGED